MSDLVGGDLVLGVPQHLPPEGLREMLHEAEAPVRRVHFLAGVTARNAALARELRLAASADSGYASITARNTARSKDEKILRTAAYAFLSERRIARALEDVA